jgi:hypothetical protein
MNIAIFISGRIVCYDTDLIPNLESMSKTHTVHLFISINGEKDEYHQEAEKRLAPWLKKIRYERYTIPEDFTPNTHSETLFQIIDNTLMAPYTVLSCFYNDLKNYEMISEYIEQTGIQMDTCVKFRADITFANKDWSIFQKSANEPDILFSNIPPAKIYYKGDTSAPCFISDAFICTSFKNLKIYCNTYNFILTINTKQNGNYRINYEPCVTENIFGKILDASCPNVKDHVTSLFQNAQLKIEYFELPYSLNRMRRSHETVQETQWWRQQKIVP